MQAIGSIAGFLIGGGSGIVESVASGGLLAPVAVAQTGAAFAAGAGAGRAAGEIFWLARKAIGQTASGGPTDEHGSELGPSGKPKIHIQRHSTLKGAKEAARQEGNGAPVKHPSPVKGRGHYHPTKDGKKIPNSTHHEYP